MFFPSPSFIITFSFYTDSCLSFFAIFVALFLFSPSFHGTPWLTAMFTRTCQFSASFVRWIASTFSCRIYLRSIAILFTYTHTHTHTHIYIKFYDNFMCMFLLSHASDLPRVFCSYWYCETIDNISKENKQLSPMCSNVEFNVQINSLHYGSVHL
jgi:hypothetical protein